MFITCRDTGRSDNGTTGHIIRHGTGREAVLRPNTGLHSLHKLFKCFLPCPTVHKAFHRHGSVGCYSNEQSQPDYTADPASCIRILYNTSQDGRVAGHVFYKRYCNYGIFHGFYKFIWPLKVFGCVITNQDNDVAYVQLHHMVVLSYIV